MAYVDLNDLAAAQKAWAEGYVAEQKANKTARDSAEEIKTQFMTLLVTQLKNQDPMNPIENQDFSAQLAQFTSLEQLITINEGVEKIAGGSMLKDLNEGVGKLADSAAQIEELNKGMNYIASLLTYLAFDEKPGAGEPPPAEE